MALCYVNGSLVDERDASVSALDHGFVVGDGVFETVLLRSGRPFALRRHLERITRSAVGLGIEPPDAEELARATRDVVAASGLADGRIRITVTDGIGPLGSARLAGPRTVVVAVAPPDADHREHCSVAVPPWRRNERGALSGLKTTSYGENVRALSWAAERGADEAIFANTRDELCEGTGSNIFVVRAGETLTPPLSSGCLAGVTRALVIETHGAVERDLPIEEFRSGAIDEAFVTSSLRGVQPVAAIDGVPLSLCPGPVTGKAAEAYLALLAASDEP